MNLTAEGSEMESRIPKGKDKKEIKEILKNEFGEEVTYNIDSNELRFCENSHLHHPEMIKLLKRFKVYIALSLF